MARILIIDDDPQVCGTIESLATRMAHLSTKAMTLTEGVELARKGNFDVVFLDVRLPDGNGLEILPEIVSLPEAPEVIILTGRGDPDGAELAIQQGVWDYLLKPSSVREITLTLGRALKYRDQKLAKAALETLDLGGVIGKSTTFKNSLTQLSEAARADSNVLITGETGTGKELFARTIHANSSRKGGSFVVVDCASLTETLVESTLFGHKRGAFTGAHSDRTGLVKLADGGTLFLDEVGEMPLAIQKSFLRVLQERRFRPVGGTSELVSDFRLLSATNKDLVKMVEAGDFRSDLLFRLKTMQIHLPPLRMRPEDIRTLTQWQTEQVCRRYGIAEKGFGSDFISTLESYEWPGNVRELLNILEQTVVAAGDEKTLYAMHLPRELRIKVARAQIRKMTGSDADTSQGDGSVRNIGQEIFEEIFEQQLPSLRDFKGMAERAYLEELIRQCEGDVSRILSLSGLSRSHFYALLKKYGLSL